MSDATLTLEEWERSALLFIAEQAAPTAAQLARFLDVYRADLNPWLARMERGCFIAVDRASDPREEWLRLKVAGHRASGSDLKRAVPRSGRYLERCRMATEVRLAVEEQLPTARWVSRRAEQLRNGLSQGGPAGVVEVDGERHCVELVLGTSVRRIVVERVHRRLQQYDAVLLWCSPTAVPVVRGGALGEMSRVLIRELPSLALKPVEATAPAVSAKGEIELADPELERLLDLLADQRALTEGQVGRLIGIPAAAVTALLVEAERIGLVLRGRPVWERERWVWPTESGLLAAGQTPGPLTEMLVDIDHRRALTEVRLATASEGEWLARRSLHQVIDARGIDALLRTADGDVAVCVEVFSRSEVELLDRYEAIVAAYRSVRCFCASRQLGKRFEALAESEDWQAIEIHAVPKPSKRLGAARQIEEREMSPSTLVDIPEVGVVALEQASGCSREEFGAVERRVGPGAKAYRVVIGGEAWRLSRRPKGWGARCLEEQR